MKKIKDLSTLEDIIHRKMDVYDTQGRRIDIFKYMYNRLYDIWMDIQEGKIFYNPDDIY